MQSAPALHNTAVNMPAMQYVIAQRRGALVLRS